VIAFNSINAAFNNVPRRSHRTAWICGQQGTDRHVGAGCKDYTATVNAWKTMLDESFSHSTAVDKEQPAAVEDTCNGVGPASCTFAGSK